MADVVICCSDEDQATARQLGDSLVKAGYSVWWDAQASSDFWGSDAVVDRIGEAKAAIALWSEASASSPMFRAQANAARTKKKLVQASADGLRPPEPFNDVQVARISDWHGETSHPGLKSIVSELERLCRPRNGSAHPQAPTPAPVDVAPLAAAPKPGRLLDALVPLAILGCVAAGALGWVSSRSLMKEEARPAAAAVAEPPAASVVAQPKAIVAAPTPAPMAAPPAVPIVQEAASPPLESVVRQPIAPRPKAERPKAAPAKAKPRTVKAPARPKVRYKNSENMRLFCERAGRGTKECRMFRRNTVRRRR